MADESVNFPRTRGTTLPVKAVDLSDGTYALSMDGTINGRFKQVDWSPANSTGAYITGDNIGGKGTLTDALKTTGSSAMLVNLVITDSSNIGPAMKILLFDSDPVCTMIDNTGFGFGTGVAQFARLVNVALADYSTVDGVAIAQPSLPANAIKGNASKDLFAAIVSATGLTFTNQASLRLRFGFDQY